MANKMAKTTVLLDLEDMANDTLDEIQEAPDYINPPAGDYVIKSISGKIGKFEHDDGTVNQNITLILSVLRTLELVSSDEPPVPDGSLFTIRFQGTSDGLATFKRELRKMADIESTAGMTINSAFELLESGLEFSARISYSRYKDRNGEVRESIRIKILPPVVPF